MTLKLQSDRRYPMGGNAILTVPGPSDGAMRIRNPRRKQRQWLGRGGWQTEPEQLGPFPTNVRADQGTDIFLPPAVCNHIEAFSVLEIRAGEFSGTVRWPEDVGVDLGVTAGADGTIKTPSSELGVTPPTARPAKHPVVVESAVDHGPPTHAEDATKEPPPVELPVREVKKSNLWFALAAVFLLVLVVIGSILVYQGSVNLSCQHESLTDADSASYEKRFEKLQECGTRADKDTTIAVLREGAKNGHGGALLEFGKSYDPNVTGLLRLTKNLSVAVEYYAKARDAGESTVAAFLERACDALDPADPLQDYARQEYCD